MIRFPQKCVPGKERSVVAFMKAISIITVNKNHASGLKRTIDSILKQTCKDYEFLVIDGASTDGSAELKEHYPQIDEFISEPDSGIYNAMNKGIGLAHGKYCLFLNSGDTLTNENVLSEVLKTLSSQPEPIDILSFRLMLPGNDSYFPRRTFDFLHFLPGSIPHQATLIRRELFDTVGKYREDYRLISDYIFFFRALCLKKVRFLTADIPFCNYEMNGVSTNRELISQEVSRYLTEHEVPVCYRIIMFLRKLTNRR